ncbi:class II fumarate hydratase [Paenibacillus larvae]|uniref:Fumarate hydratase class II n=4 Tax=Paenibacillus larvae TaxID=1464 RepID=V9W827_9BACL|nr:aspartate ammonia-lyase [Paenibacillus larvae]AHD05845.1 fumarate hydratase class II [Paenibacillus larvae subsp. larvae DSM 25430]AVG12385.1 fumarate hydratase class II [Paenibacillus larvae subsp. larvae DSM 25430]MDR5569588.1 aspartate ammonia-lyase [Paenibacillus larvae]MDR5596126.1 aspartate ammonia-lyase [Paenibacillus larvae]QHZ51629.1 fumarate hydratase class II [Paenibacillus larvae subsp. larvae]
MNDMSNNLSGLTRVSEDSLGKVEIPEKAYFGPQTQRAVENFAISGLTLPRRFIKAQGIIKAAAALVHQKLGLLPDELTQPIIQAAEEVIDGRFDQEFVVDVYQAGAGTSQNMNANEVIANRALEIMGVGRDRKDIIHPNDHVNKSQSTNDTIPTAIYMSTYDALEEELLPSFRYMIKKLKEKSVEFHQVPKSGRTHLQDAVPMRLGQEFEGYAGTFESVLERILPVMDDLLEIGIGGNAVGTGIHTHPKYAELMTEEIARRTGRPFRSTANRFAFMQNPSAALRVSGLLREIAVHLIKMTSDLRLLNSGLHTGLAEINLPAVQPGSSIMPGKVNPVLPEMTYMVCSQVIGNDTAIQTAMIGGQLEINVMMPVIAHNVLFSISILSRTMKSLSTKCLKGIEANREQSRWWMEQSLSLVTLLNPVIGYDHASRLAKQSLQERKPLKEVVLASGVINEVEWNQLVEESLG